MTLLRPARPRQSAGALVLGERDRDVVERLIDADPLVNAVACARVHAAHSLVPAALGGTLFGVRAPGSDRQLLGAALHAGTLLPIGGTPAAWRALAGAVGRRAGVCSSIVGSADAVRALWAVLARRWGPARGVRQVQPLLVLDGPGPSGGDSRVRKVGRAQLEAYLAAAAAMFVEELDVPAAQTRRTSFRARALSLIDAGRAFAVFGRDGRVQFKADIAAVTPHTCQIQGVWVRPELRGRGLGTAALASVLRHGLCLAPTVSLYVNDYNTPARRVYAKLGMRQHATLATVLL